VRVDAQRGANAREIRTRCHPLWNFDNLEEVEATIQGLIEKDTGALIVKLPRQAEPKSRALYTCLQAKCRLIIKRLRRANCHHQKAS